MGQNEWKEEKKNAHQIVKRACFTLMTIKINRVRQKKSSMHTEYQVTLIGKTKVSNVFQCP